MIGPDTLRRSVMRWWESKRPSAWDEDTHIQNPRVNCVGPEECELAYIAAALAQNTDSRRTDG